jgi:hypothetical protein
MTANQTRDQEHRSHSHSGCYHSSCSLAIGSVNIYHTNEPSCHSGDRPWRALRPNPATPDCPVLKAQGEGFPPENPPDAIRAIALVAA